MITNHKLDALCLTGTCLKPDSYIHLNESTPQGSYCKHESHPKGKAGGIAIVYSNIFSFIQRPGFN